MSFYEQFETPLDLAVDKADAERWAKEIREFAAYRDEVERWAKEIREFSQRTGRHPHRVVDQVKFEITLPRGEGS